MEKIKEILLGFEYWIKVKIKIHFTDQVFDFYEKQFCINLSQMRVMDRKRLLRRIGDMALDDFTKIKVQIRRIVG